MLEEVTLHTSNILAVGPCTDRDGSGRIKRTSLSLLMHLLICTRVSESRIRPKLVPLVKNQKDVKLHSPDPPGFPDRKSSKSKPIQH